MEQENLSLSPASQQTPAVVLAQNNVEAAADPIANPPDKSLAPNELIGGEMTPNKLIGGEMTPNELIGGEMTPNKLIGGEMTPNELIGGEMAPNELNSGETTTPEGSTLLAEKLGGDKLTTMAGETETNDLKLGVTSTQGKDGELKEAVEQTEMAADEIVSSVADAVLETADPATPPLSIDEDSCQSNAPSETNANSPQKRTRVTTSKLMQRSLPQGVGAEALFEYRWPPGEDNYEYWMLQEQVSVFLDVKSFRRKYPDLERRQIDIEERNYLVACGVVTEMQCDLGLTALKSEDISDLMIQDYPDKYDEYAKVLRSREEQRLTKKHQHLQELQSNSAPAQAAVSKLDMKKVTERAVRSAASYNAILMKERREERQHYYDIQTGIVQYPKNKRKALPPELTRPSLYPVAVLRGQYSDSYSRYNSSELSYLPLKTARYPPPPRIHNPYVPLPPAVEDNPPVPLPVLNASSVPQPAAAANRKAVTKLIDSTCLLCGREENKSGNAEKCIRCTECMRESHPSCCELTEEMLAVVVTYNWMCMECKVCVRCSDPGNEDKMIVCDNCDRGYHTFCVGLKSIPEESIWACPECTAAA